MNFSIIDDMPVMIWIRNSIKRGGNSGSKRLDFFFKKLYLVIRKMNGDVDSMGVKDLFSNRFTQHWMMEIWKYIKDRVEFTNSLIEKEMMILESGNNTANKVTFVDGEEKILSHRVELAENLVNALFGEHFPEKQKIIKEKLVSLFNDNSFNFMRFFDDPNYSVEATRIHTEAIKPSLTEDEFAILIKESNYDVNVKI